MFHDLREGAKKTTVHLRLTFQVKKKTVLALILTRKYRCFMFKMYKDVISATFFSIFYTTPQPL
jgi:hypothetical protein